MLRGQKRHGSYLDFVRYRTPNVIGLSTAIAIDSHAGGSRTSVSPSTTVAGNRNAFCAKQQERDVESGGGVERMRRTAYRVVGAIIVAIFLTFFALFTRLSLRGVHRKLRGSFIVLIIIFSSIPNPNILFTFILFLFIVNNDVSD